MTQKEHVYRTARAMVKKSGLINLSQVELCSAANIPVGSFSYIMGCSFSDLIDELNDCDTPKHRPVTKTRANPKLRKEQILSTALDLARKNGCHKITRDSIARKAGVSEGLVSKYFGTMNNLRRTVMRAAISQRIPEIVGKGLANNDPYARKAPKDLREIAIATIS